MKTLDINLLRTMIAFAESGSCQGAASVVHRTQAAVSVHLKRLEEIAGKQLFEKVGRRLKLTPYGENMVAYARQIVRLHNEALAAFEPGTYTGTVRIGLPDDYIAVLLDILLLSFSSALPKAQLDLVCAPSAELRLLLAANTLDIAILSCETDTKEGYVLRKESSHWLASSGYSHIETPKKKLLLFPEGCILRKWALNALTARGIDYEIVCTSHNMQALKTAMSHGMGVMIATECNIPTGSVSLSENMGFPALPEVTIMVSASSNADPSLVQPLYNALRTYRAWQPQMPRAASYFQS